MNNFIKIPKYFDAMRTHNNGFVQWNVGIKQRVKHRKI